ncbi:MAG: nuclear transport factor 2 family protein, partial [Actinomycetota bacterium]
VDRVILPKMDYEIGGTAFYSDSYVREDGQWKISHTGYVRVFEEHRTYSTGALLRFNSRFDASPS